MVENDLKLETKQSRNSSYARTKGVLRVERGVWEPEMPQDRKRPGNGEFLELVVPKDQRAPRRIVLPGEEVSWG